MSRFHPAERPKPKKWDGRALKLKRIEAKMDGYRATIVAGVETKKLMGRSAHRDYLYDMLDEDSEAMLKTFSKVPPGTVIDGELYLVDRPASEISNAFKHGGEFRFQPFAIPLYKGKSCRNITFEKRDEHLASMGFFSPTTLNVREDFHERVTRSWLQEEARRAKIEGWILKENHWGNWWKVKPVETVDAFVVNTKPGVGKHKGRLGAMEVAVYKTMSYSTPKGIERAIMADVPPTIIASVGKGNDEKWRDMTHEEVLGRVVEVEYEEVQARGKLKFSSFLRWRDEKDMEECTDEQLS